LWINIITNKLLIIQIPKIMKYIISIIFLILWNSTVAQNNTTIPYLAKTNGKSQLYVKNEPFLMIAGELTNSTTGSAHYMHPIWNSMAKQNLNTVLAPVSWELIEPKEGSFDFSIVDSMILGARHEKLKLVLLWFGSWKNGKSTYVPEWVKTNTKRFPLIKDKKGESMNILSTFGNNTLQADAKAFTVLMKHIKEIDISEQTVIMVQVQNEIGVLDLMSSYMGTENAGMRDYSEVANKAFNGQVPEQLMTYLHKHRNELYPALKKAWAENGYRKEGTWEEVFGKGTKYQGENWKENFSFYTEEIFMAWNYACYVGEIAKQGKAEYPLPLFVNAWLKQPKAKEPGHYPSGGPLPQVLDIWRAAAPSIDFIAPDIYVVEEFDWICSEFARSDNPLFIPETIYDTSAAARSFYAFGKYNVLGYAPYGIDGESMFHSTTPDDKDALKKTYKCLNAISPYILKYRGTENMFGIFIDKEKNKIEFSDYSISFERTTMKGTFGMFGVDVDQKGGENESAAGFIVFRLADNEFLIAGGVGGVMINIAKGTNCKWENVGLASVDEITFENGKMLTHRLNGDETAMGAAILKPGEVKIFKIKLYGY
jgi:hypothetical protein